jgi:hypothetical protein
MDDEPQQVSKIYSKKSFSKLLKTVHCIGSWVEAGAKSKKKNPKKILNESKMYLTLFKKHSKIFRFHVLDLI